ncbi:MAG: hypothetical protein EBX78_10405, partial [Gammaproteobacteria bacterium]|nr:hypothetical protein [Gammaproteobacteria bacterium]
MIAAPPVARRVRCRPHTDFGGSEPWKQQIFRSTFRAASMKTSSAYAPKCSPWAASSSSSS